jgi:hypothetical protein
VCVPRLHAFMQHLVPRTNGFLVHVKCGMRMLLPCNLPWSRLFSKPPGHWKIWCTTLIDYVALGTRIFLSGSIRWGTGSVCTKATCNYAAFGTKDKWTSGPCEMWDEDATTLQSAMVKSCWFKLNFDISVAISMFPLKSIS